MNNLDEQKKIVILIDADNAQVMKVKNILEEISAHGHIVIKRAYGDWSSSCLKNWKQVLNELAIQPIQQFAYTTGKNSTDASMIIDAMDLLHLDEFDVFVLVSSDSDFTKLASRLRESEIIVYGVGEKKTPVSFQNSCDNFIYTENIGEMKNIQKPSFTKDHSAQDLIPLLQKAWEQCKDKDGWANMSLVGNYLKQSNPDFDPRTYPGAKLSQIIESLRSTFRVRRRKNANGNATIVKYRPITKS
ncbi:NYN domain-containing protein [bacterium]|nr:NYN domain-containing protein [bacterium]